MVEALTAQEMQQLERHTIDEIGMHPQVLTERIALSVIDVIAAGKFDLSNILVIAGLGNNGGNGVAITRLLRQKGVNVELLVLGDERRATPHTATQLQIARNYGIETQTRVRNFKNYTLVIDALFGIGLSKPVPAKLGEVIKRVNVSNVPVVAVDVPSGINATTGEIMGTAMRAKATVTFGYPKQGMMSGEGQTRSGDIYVKDIGIYTEAELANFTTTE